MGFTQNRFQSLQAQNNQIFHGILFTKFIFDERAEIGIIRGKLCIEGDNHQTPLNGSGFVLDTGNIVGAEQELGIIVELKWILAFALHIHPITRDQLLEHGSIGNKFITNIITDVRQLSEQFSGFEPVPKFLQVKGSNVGIPKHILHHMKEGGFAVALIANQDEGFSKFIAPVQAIAHHFFQQGPNFRIVTGQPVKGVIQQFRIGGGIVGPRDFICDHHIRGEVPE